MSAASAPPPALVADLKELRRVLTLGLTCPPSQLAPLLFEERHLLSHFGARHVPAMKASQTVLAASLRHLQSEGTIPHTVLALLRRLQAASPAAPAQQPSTPGGQAVPPQYIAVTSFSVLALLAPLVQVARTATSIDALEASEAFVLALARAQPCADVVATLQLIQTVSGGGPTAHSPTFPPAPAAGATYADVWPLYATIARLGSELFEHSLMVEPFAAALHDGAAASRLLHHACEALTHTLVGPSGAPRRRGEPTDTLEQALGAVTTLVIRVTNCAGPAGGEGPFAKGRGARAAALRTLFAEPAFPRLLLAALMQYSGPRTLIPAGDSGTAGGQGEAAAAAAAVQSLPGMNILATMQVLRFWIAPPGATAEQEAARRHLASQAGMSALQVAHVAKVSAACAGEVSGNVITLLYGALPLGDQALALPAVVAHAGALLDRLTEWYASGGTSDVFARDGFGKWAEGIDPGRCSEMAVHLYFRMVTDDGAGMSGKVPLPRAASRCVLHLGLLGKTEALLRARTCPPPATLPAGGRCEAPKRHPDDIVRHCSAAQLACAAAAAVVAHALDDEQRVGPALAAFQSLLVTTRKLIVTAGSSPATAADGSSSLPAMVLYSSPCMAIAAMLGAPVLRDPLQAGRPAATLVARAWALQLLPPLLQGCTAYVVAQPATGRDWTPAQLAHLDTPLLLLKRLHSAGMANVTLGAGAMGLLHAVLQALRPTIASGVQAILLLLLLVVDSALECEGWRVEGVRLVDGGLATWSGYSAPHQAVSRLRHLDARLHDSVASAIRLLQTRSQASALGDSTRRSLTWDSCALSTVTAATANGCVPFLGCWNTGCTNMEGGSEAVLKLSRCSSCQLARYCSISCQKQAWAGGHRSACGAWKEQNRTEAAAGSTESV